MARVVQAATAHLVSMDHDESTRLGLEPFLDVRELAQYLGVPVTTVYEWRTHGRGPVAHRFGKHLKFAIADVRDWVQQQRDTPTGG